MSTKPRKPAKVNLKRIPANMKRNLTPLEKTFVEVFDGHDVAESLREAGFRGSDEDLHLEALRLLKKPAVRYALRLKDTNPLIADKEMLQEYWTDIALHNPYVRTQDKLKASELLAKSQGALTDVVEHKGDTLSDLIIQSNVQINDK